jgi:hypothetical protein
MCGSVIAIFKTTVTLSQSFHNQFDTSSRIGHEYEIELVWIGIEES